VQVRIVVDLQTVSASQIPRHCAGVGFCSATIELILIPSLGRESKRAAVDDAVGLLPVSGEALGEHLYLAPSALRFHEDCERSVSPFPLQYCSGRRD
jgi:hypothetical protein